MHRRNASGFTLTNDSAVATGCAHARQCRVAPLVLAALILLACPARAEMTSKQGPPCGEADCACAAKTNPGLAMVQAPSPTPNSEYIMRGGLALDPPDGEGYVMMGTRGLLHHFLDIQVDHVMGPPLEIHRHYNSEWADWYDNLGPYKPVFGQNWQLNVQSVIEIIGGYGPANNEDVWVVRAPNQGYTLYENEGGTFWEKYFPDGHVSFIREDREAPSEANGNRGRSYRYLEDGAYQVFETPINNTAPTPDVPGKLLKYCTAKGFCQSYTYDGDLLQRIEDDYSGRGLDFTWTTIQGVPRLTRIEGPGGREVIYEYESALGVDQQYDPTEHTYWPNPPPTAPVDVRLKRVITPTRIEKYTYDFGWFAKGIQSNPGLRYVLYMTGLTFCENDGGDEANCKEVARWEWFENETDVPNALDSFTRPADPSVPGDSNETYELKRYATIPMGNPACPEFSEADCVQTRVTMPDQTSKTDYFVQFLRSSPVIYKVSGSGCAACGASGDTEYGYDFQRRLTSVKDARGAVTAFVYPEGYLDLEPRLAPLTARVEAQGTSLERTESYTYARVPLDAGESEPTATLLTQVQRPNQSTVTYDYDDDGDAVSNESPTAFVHRVIEVGKTDIGLAGSPGDGNPGESRTVTRTFGYTGGLLTSMVGPGSQSTTLTYTAAGDVETVTRAMDGDDLVTTYGSFSANGTPRAVEDPNQVVTTFTLDAADRVLSTSIPIGAQTATTTVTYDAFGNIISTDLPEAGTGSSSVITSKNRVRDQVNGEGEKLRATYDALGRKTSDLYLPAGSSSAARTIEYDYDNPNDAFEDVRSLWKVKEIGKATPDGSNVTSTTEFGYDAAGNRTSVVDGSGKTLAYTFDDLHRLATVTQAGGTADQVVTTYLYDGMSNLTRVTVTGDARITYYAYDDWNRVTKVESPDSGTTIYNYDASGNLFQKKDARGQVATYHYDALDRLTDIDYTASSTADVAYTYDAATASGLGFTPSFQKGRVAQVTDESGTTIFSYDEAGRTRFTAQSVNGGPSRWLSTEYRYDLNGNLRTLVYPDDRTLTIATDLADRPVGATLDGEAVVTDMTYAPFGPRTSFEYGNGIATSAPRGLFYEPVRITTSVGASPVDVLRRDYALALNGNIASIEDVPSSATNSYVYDGVNRLKSGTQGVGGFGAFSYTYDRLGNRLSKTEGGVTDTYGYGGGTPTSSRLQSTSGLTYGYDAMGSMTAMTGTGTPAFHTYVTDLDLAYNPAARTSAVTRDGVRFEYLSDYQARRVVKRAQTDPEAPASSQRVARIFIHDLSGNILSELNPAGYPIADYVYVGGDRLMKLGLVPTEDADEDGIPNGYEEKYNLDPLNAEDAEEDPDGDVFSNLEESQLAGVTDPFQADTDHDGYTDFEEVNAGTDPLDAASSPGIGGSIAIYEDHDCNKVFDAGHDRAIETLVKAGPFSTNDCVMIFSTANLIAPSISISAARGITVWGRIEATATNGAGISLASDGTNGWLDLSGARLVTAASPLALHTTGTLWLTGARLQAKTGSLALLVSITTGGLLNGVQAQILAPGSGSQVVITASGRITLSRATIQAGTDIGITSTGADVVLASASLSRSGTTNTEVAVSANGGAGTIDIRGATIRDDDPTYDGSLIGNGNPPSTAFPSFTPGQQIPAGNNPKRIATADFNGDNYPDVAIALTGTFLDPSEPGSDVGSLLVLLGNAQGKLTPFARYDNVGRGPTEVVVGDFNGDGAPDLAVTRVGNALASLPGTDPGGVAIYLGDGTGGFTKRASYTSGTAPGALVAADFNGDNKTDLAVARTGFVILFGPNGPEYVGANPASTVEVFRGRGNGTFVRAGIYTVNGDQRPDLAVACIQGPEGSGKVSVLLNNGSGAFSLQSPALDVGDDPTSVRFLTLNTDSHLDLAVGKTTLDSPNPTSTVLALTGNGSGGFAASDAVAVSGQVWYVGIGDVTEGNGEDVVVTNIAGAFSVLANQADGTLGEPQVTSDGLFPRSLALADFDIDGHLDAAVIDDQVDLVRVYPGRGDGTFRTAKAFVSQTTPVHLIHGDWDGDPYPDVATLNVDSGDIQVFVGSSSQTFTQSDTISTVSAVTIATADLNEDEHADLIWGAVDAGVVKVAYGNGDGTFQAPATLGTSGISPLMVEAGLFSEGDAHADLAVIGYTSNGLALRLYPGEGDGTLGTPGEVSLDASEAPTALASGDLDGDGRIDFAVAYESGLVRVVMGANTAELSLGASMTITEGSFPRSVVIADLDGDGDLDVATANSGVVFGANGPDEQDPDGRVSIFRNDGSATFAADSPVPVASYPMNVEAGDLNGDGYPDLSVVHLTDFGASTPTQVGIEVLISDAQGGFLGPEETLVGYAPFSHVIVDLDGDGLNDAVVADPATSLVTVLRNELTVALDHRATPRTRFARGQSPAAPVIASLDGVRLASLSPSLTPGLLTRPRAADVLEAASYAGYWYHNDHLGTPQVMTDENREVVWKGFYKPFGEVVAPVEDVINPFRFPGQYQDQEIGFLYNHFRIFRNEVGRYLVEDPLSRSPLLRIDAAYSYAVSNPLTYRDADGLTVRKCHTRGKGSGSASRGDLLDVGHGYVCYTDVFGNDVCRGAYPDRNKGAGGVFNSTAEVQDDGILVPDSDCEEVPSACGEKFDECVNEILWYYGLFPPSYGIPFRHCYSFVDKVVSECEFRCRAGQL